MPNPGSRKALIGSRGLSGPTAHSQGTQGLASLPQMPCADWFAGGGVSIVPPRKRCPPPLLKNNPRRRDDRHRHYQGRSVGRCHGPQTTEAAPRRTVAERGGDAGATGRGPEGRRGQSPPPQRGAEGRPGGDESQSDRVTAPWVSGRGLPGCQWADPPHLTHRWGFLPFILFSLHHLSPQNISHFGSRFFFAVMATKMSVLPSLCLHQLPGWNTFSYCVNMNHMQIKAQSGANPPLEVGPGQDGAKMGAKMVPALGGQEWGGGISPISKSKEIEEARWHVWAVKR